MADWVRIGWHTSDVYDFPTQIPDFLTKYQTYDLVIPMFHGVYGEDGQISAFLETLGCPYAYSSFMVHSFCIDKYRTNLFVAQIGVKIPRSYYVARGHYIERMESPLVCYPAIVKPNRWGSSIATAKVDSRTELIAAQQSIVGDDIIIQECIEGREFTVGVYRGADGYHAIPIAEIITQDGVLFDYSEKYETDGYNEVFAELPDTLRRSLEQQSTLIASALTCRGVVRIDWRYDGSDLYFLEVNTIPGFTSGSLVPKMWKKAGKTEGEFVEMLGF
jgi:D-alanine-D-alanine ligase